MRAQANEGPRLAEADAGSELRGRSRRSTRGWPGPSVAAGGFHTTIHLPPRDIHSESGTTGDIEEGWRWQEGPAAVAG